MSEITLPWPPSMNSYWRSVGGRVLISKDGREYREHIQALALSLKWPKFHAARVTVEIEAWMPDRRRRDLDNLLKAVLDSLTHAGVWNDDSQIDDLRIVRAPHIGGMLKVRIHALQKEAAE